VKHERGKIGMALLFAVLIAMLAFLSIGSVSAAQQHYVNPGESIQGAIDNATAGDTIIVRDGTYTENVDVNVNYLTIKSENGYDSTIVQAANTSDHVFAVTADYVNITEFTVTGATGDYKGGIYLYGAEHCIISDNNASNNYRGIYLYHSSNNSVTNNVVKGNNDQGIRLSSSNNSMLINNTAEDNRYGIYLYSSSNDMLRNNKVMYNGNTGISLQDSNDNRIIGPSRLKRQQDNW
jgi:parallel beta-helix repeat protein